MESISQLFEHILDPYWIMNHGGLYLVLLILFLETGFILGFFLPGDPLLFISGVIISSANEAHYPFSIELLNLLYWMVIFMASTILGNFFGYWFGRKFNYLLNRPDDTWFLKRKHMVAAHEFYERNGGFAIAIARFLPIVRTFAPIVAGSVKMDLKKFSFYNVFGAVIWVGSLTSLGFVLGDIPWVRDNLELIILFLVFLVTAPVFLKLFLKKEAA